MAKTRSRRVERPPNSDQLVVRGILGRSTDLDPSDLKANVLTNHEVYGFYAISVWIADSSHALEYLEQTKLVKFDRYAVFVVADLAARGLDLWATGRSPHYDVVHSEHDPDSLVKLFAATPHQIRLNPSVDREEH